MKTCTKCGEAKEFSEFYKMKNSKDGYEYSCKECISIRRKEIRENPILQLQKAVRSSVIVENKILFKENKIICSGCKNIFFISDTRDNYCKDCMRKMQQKYNNKEESKKLRRANCYKYSLKNKEKRNEYWKEYYEKNKEKIIEKTIEYSKKYREENKSEVLEKEKKYREKNKEKIKENSKKYLEENKEKAKERAKIWKKENKEKVKEYQRQYRLKRKEAIS